jgi:glycine oxidase
MDDCLILGAGVIGLSIAYELSGHGLRVRVLDRQQAGTEASWAGAGILPPINPSSRPRSPQDALLALSMRLHAEWAGRLREETGIDTEYRRCGGWHLELQQHEVGQVASAMSREQESAARVSLPELASREPALADACGNSTIRSADFAADEAQLRNPRHLAALGAACRRRGVRIEENVEATGFWSSAGQVVGAQTSAGPKYAGAFCIATGSWTGRLAQTIGLSVPIKPIRGQIVLLDRPKPSIKSIVNVGKRYLVPRLDGRVLVGSTMEDAGFDKRNTSEGVEGLLQFARGLIPAWRDAEVERAWAGLRPATPDELPYLGRVPIYTNLFVAAGHFREGITWSPATAVLMSALIRGQNPQIDLTPFKLDRSHAQHAE